MNEPFALIHDGADRREARSMSATRGRTEALGAPAPERTRLGEGVQA